MHISLNSYDHAILRALRRNGALTTAQLSEAVHLSPSQCSRRRLRMEKAGIITGYHARLNAQAMGLSLRAVVRVNLNSHSEKNARDFSNLLNAYDEIIEAFSVSGDADYVLIMQCKDLANFADFIHTVLLPQPIVGQVKSEIALRQIKRL